MSIFKQHGLPIALLALSIVACRASSSAPPSTIPLPHRDDTGYRLPAGLKWGLSPEEAKQALVAHGFSFRGQEASREGRLKQTYQGTFSGFALDSLTASFRDGGLNGVALMLPALDPRPATQRWQELVDAMKGAGGDPTRLSPLPKAGGLASRGGYAALDQKIRQGVPGPYATWLSENTMVTISVNVSELDSAGVPSLRPAWAYFGPGSLYVQHEIQEASAEEEE